MDKKRGVVNDAMRVRSEKLRVHQYRKGYARSLERKIVEWDEESNVKHLWEQEKKAMVESAREVYGSVNVRVKDKEMYGGMMR